MSDVAIRSVPLKTIGLWVLRVLVALPFLAGAAFKLSGQPMMVAEFGLLGIGIWFMYLTGVLEVIGGIAVLVPAVSGFGAILLLCIDIGAFAAQVLVIRQDWVHTVIIGILIAALIYVQRSQIRQRLGL